MGPSATRATRSTPTAATDGTPTAEAFQVTFDRPVDPATFLPNDVQVLFRDTTPNNLTGGFVPVTSVVPLNLGLYGATEFQVNFAPRNGVGTYSYSISPNVSDRIRRSRRRSSPLARPIDAPARPTFPSTIPAASTQTSNLTVTGFRRDRPSSTTSRSTSRSPPVTPAA